MTSLSRFSLSSPSSKPTSAFLFCILLFIVQVTHTHSFAISSRIPSSVFACRIMRRQQRATLPTRLFAVVEVADIISNTVAVSATAPSCLLDLASASTIIADNIVETVASTSSSSSSSSSSWRQYVPLVVSLGVIADILLGSPVANTVMAPLKGVQEELKQPQQDSKNRRERVDSEAIAQQALNQAYASMELRDYLERNKSDEQRMQELRNKMDREMNQVDQVLKERQSKLDAGEY